VKFNDNKVDNGLVGIILIGGIFMGKGTFGVECPKFKVKAEMLARCFSSRNQVKSLRESLPIKIANLKVSMDPHVLDMFIPLESGKSIKIKRVLSAIETYHTALAKDKALIEWNAHKEYEDLKAAKNNLGHPMDTKLNIIRSGTAGFTVFVATHILNSTIRLADVLLVSGLTFVVTFALSSFFVRSDKKEALNKKYGRITDEGYKEQVRETQELFKFLSAMAIKAKA
jgi:hypothetical protein